MKFIMFIVVDIQRLIRQYYTWKLEPRIMARSRIESEFGKWIPGFYMILVTGC